MDSRLQSDSLELRRSLRNGRSLSVSDRRLLAGLASAESRIIGSARLGKLRDVAVALLRVVTLIAAVLLPALQSPPDPTTVPPPVQVAVIPVTVPPPTETPTVQHPVTVNVDVESVPGEGSGTFEVIQYTPLKVRASGRVVIGSSAGYWYRAVLGEDDVFWALPDGDFSFTLIGWVDGCDEGDPCASLLFEFHTGEIQAVESHLGEVVIGLGPDRSAIDAPSSEMALKVCESPDAKGVTRCRWRQNLIIDIRGSKTPSTEQGKTAFDVRWCRIGIDEPCPRTGD
jgi:hypothetical protein